MRRIKNPKAGERVLICKDYYRSPLEPFIICNFFYKAVFPDGTEAYVGWTHDEGIVGYNGKYKHCFRIDPDDDLSEYKVTMKLEKEKCRDCNGTGKILNSTCKHCSGTGYVIIQVTNPLNYCGYCGAPLNGNSVCAKCGCKNN